MSLIAPSCLKGKGVHDQHDMFKMSLRLNRALRILECPRPQDADADTLLTLSTLVTNVHVQKCCIQADQSLEVVFAHRLSHVFRDELHGAICQLQ